MNNVLSLVLSLILICPSFAALDDVSDSQHNLKHKTATAQAKFPGIKMRTGFAVTEADQQELIKQRMVQEMHRAFQNLPLYLERAHDRYMNFVESEVLELLPASVKMALLADESKGEFKIQANLINDIGFQGGESGQQKAEHMTQLAIKILQADLQDKSEENIIFQQKMVSDAFLSAVDALGELGEPTDLWLPENCLDYHQSMGQLYFWAALHNPDVTDKKYNIQLGQVRTGQALKYVLSHQENFTSEHTKRLLQLAKSLYDYQKYIATL